MEFSDETLITRGQLAQKLGVSYQEVNRRIRVGALQPYIKRGKEPLFHTNQIEEQRMLSRKRSGVEPGKDVPVLYTGKDASRVFAALEEGKSLLSIVRDLELHPDIVEAASLAYARLQNSLFVSYESVKALEKMPLDGEFPIASDKQLVEMLRAALEEAACSECKRKARKVCLGCARSLARKGKRAVEVEDEG